MTKSGLTLTKGLDSLTVVGRKIKIRDITTSGTPHPYNITCVACARLSDNGDDA